MKNQLFRYNSYKMIDKMKKSKLNYLGTQEMGVTEMIKVTGGIPLLVPAIGFNILVFLYNAIMIKAIAKA